MKKIKRSIVQSAILWEVMKSYKILENAMISTQKDNLTERKIREKPDFTKFFREKLWLQEVVESCQMCWISNGMQQVCNTNINDMYRTFSEKSGNVLFTSFKFC